MAINSALLIAAPMLQDYLVDNATGLPLANGTITLYKDRSRTTFKNWYYQTGTADQYTYTTLPNPMTLSGVGTIQDGNGNDVIPMYYPVSETDNATPETYYIVVQNSNGQQQFTRQNFPFNATNSPNNQGDLTLENYIVNNVFWRNFGSKSLTNVTQATLAPSNHDGFSMPDIQFFKQATGANDTVTFTKFNPGQFLNPDTIDPQNLDVTPEYYMNFTCAGSGSETSKYIQFPIALHIKSLETTPAIFSFWGRCNNSGGSGGNEVSVTLLQFTGTGTSSPSPITLATFILPITSAFQEQIVEFNFTECPAFSTLGVGGDDAFYLQINYPLGVTFNIDIAKPSLYLGNKLASNECQVYDKVDAIINSPRTGDVRTSINSFYPFGWVPMNNGTIGDASSNSTARANQDTWPLFNLLWSVAKPYDSGASSNPICQMYDSSASATNFGSSAIADFTANNQLALTNMFGQVVMGTVPISALLPVFSQTITGSADGNGDLLITVTTGSTSFYQGQPITFTTTGSLPGGINANQVYYVSAVGFGNTTFNVATSFANAITQTVIVWSSNGSNSTVYFQLNGSQNGEFSHAQLVSELAVHNHAAGGGQQFIRSGATPMYASGPASISLSGTTASTGTGMRFNVIQPSTFYNIYMKL